jgi:tRNA U38,U39,U40 pseudouridine synthase TruA
MQHNPGMATIEGEVMKALHKAGAVSDENAGDFLKV